MEKRGFQGFWRRKGGQVAVIMALMMLPIAAVVGFAIDASRQVTAKQSLQSFTDFAALAGAKNLAKTGDAAASRAIAIWSFRENRASKHSDVVCTVQAATADSATLEVNLATSCGIPTIFGTTINGNAKMSVKTVSTAKASVSRLDLVLALDTSSSMSTSKLMALKRSAKGLVDQLATPDGRVRIALVPYGSSVNAGVYGNRAAGRADTDDTEHDGVGRVCVTERKGAEAFSDAKPQPGAWTGAPAGRTKVCGRRKIVPLSTDTDALKTAIQNLTRSGYTRGHLAVAWSWYLISPNWADFWPVDSKPLPYGSPIDKKVIVLMTDGVFNGARSGMGLGTAVEQGEKLCDEIRATGIIIFSIAFQAPAAGQTLMRNCATSASHYFEADDENGLDDAFKTIGRQFYGVSITG